MKRSGFKTQERHKRMLIIWIAIYPLITLLYYFLGESLASLPLAVRTLILTGIAIPVMVYLLVPLLTTRLLRPWL